MSIDVEIDLFSGRVNPRWTLSEPDAVTVRAALAGLTETQQNEAGPPDLGYRGFRIHEGESITTVHGGWIGRAGRIYTDKDRVVELLLLDTLPPELASMRPMVLAHWG